MSVLLPGLAEYYGVHIVMVMLWFCLLQVNKFNNIISVS